MHYDPKCRKVKHKCHLVCISQNCTVANPFVCEACGNHHSNDCEIIEYKELVHRMHKLQGINKKAIYQYENYVEDTFRTLIKSLQAEFILFREHFEHLNASSHITYPVTHIASTIRS